MRSLYRPGHDARHASQITQRLHALGDLDEAVLAELPSQALRDKVRNGFNRSRPSKSVQAQPAEAVAPATPPADRRSTQELLQGYAGTLAELRRRGLIRSGNAPAGDYSEWITARALHGTLVDNFSVKSYDLTMARSYEAERARAGAKKSRKRLASLVL